MTFELIETSSAEISPCGNHRWRLDRRKDRAGPVVAFFGITPSTADGLAEDATTRKWHGFCEHNGWGRYIVGNVFTQRSTDVRALRYPVESRADTTGFRYFCEIMAEADILVPCWGSRMKLPKKLRGLLDHRESVLRESCKPIRIFGLTASGDPKHPLMLPYNTPLVEWEQS